jgi:hypothetical protein
MQTSYIHDSFNVQQTGTTLGSTLNQQSSAMQVSSWHATTSAALYAMESDNQNNSKGDTPLEALSCFFGQFRYRVSVVKFPLTTADRQASSLL